MSSILPWVVFIEVFALFFAIALPNEDGLGIMKTGCAIIAIVVIIIAYFIMVAAGPGKVKAEIAEKPLDGDIYQ